MESLEKLSSTILDECSHCKSSNIIKYGTYKNRQRYKCRNCNKTFTIFTNKPWSYSKKPLSYWKEYATFMDSKLSLRSCSISLSINLKTAFLWRHKILEYIEESNTNKLSNTIGILKYNIFENRKGKRNIQTEARELSYIYAKDSRDNFAIDITDRINFNYRYVKDFLSKSVIPNSKVLRTNNNIVNIGIEKFINRKFTKKENSFVGAQESGVFEKNSQYTSWIRSFNGVATVFQLRYHHWFNCREKIATILKGMLVYV